MLFQEGIIDIIDLMIFIMPFFLLSGYVLLVVGGAIELEKNERVQKSSLFIIIGAFGIIPEFLMSRIYWLVDEIFIVGFDEYYFIIFIIPNIISIITFGILIIVLGKLNRQNFGNFLLISGILWTIYSITVLIINLENIIPFPGPPSSVVAIFNILGLAILTFLIGARILLVVYSSKIGNNFLLVSSIFLLISSVALVIFSLLNVFVP